MGNIYFVNFRLDMALVNVTNDISSEWVFINMISIIKSKTISAPARDVFESIESVQKLSRFKREISNFRLARDETGLQIIDITLGFIIMQFESRLKYTSVPHRYAELKILKGRLKDYSCAYTIVEKGTTTDINVKLNIKLPYGPLGFLVAGIARPLYAYRLKRELTLLGKNFKQR